MKSMTSDWKNRRARRYVDCTVFWFGPTGSVDVNKQFHEDEKTRSKHLAHSVPIGTTIVHWGWDSGPADRSLIIGVASLVDPPPLDSSSNCHPSHSNSRLSHRRQPWPPRSSGRQPFAPCSWRSELHTPSSLVASSQNQSVCRGYRRRPLPGLRTMRHSASCRGRHGNQHAHLARRYWDESPRPRCAHVAASLTHCWPPTVLIGRHSGQARTANSARPSQR